MSNPLFSQLAGGQNNIVGMLTKFNEFKRTFSGDPKQEVMKLLQSGRMSQEQFNQLQSMAQQLSGLMK